MEVLITAGSMVKSLGANVNLDKVFFQVSPMPIDIYNELLRLSGTPHNSYNKTFKIQNENKDVLYVQFIGNSMKVGASI